MPTISTCGNFFSTAPGSIHIVFSDEPRKYTLIVWSPDNKFVTMSKPPTLCFKGLLNFFAAQTIPIPSGRNNDAVFKYLLNSFDLLLKTTISGFKVQIHLFFVLPSIICLIVPTTPDIVLFKIGKPKRSTYF